MVRKIPSGNGQMLIVSNRDYRIRDIYYPTVGRKYHSGGLPPYRKYRQRAVS